MFPFYCHNYHNIPVLLNMIKPVRVCVSCVSSSVQLANLRAYFTRNIIIHAIYSNEYLTLRIGVCKLKIKEKAQEEIFTARFFPSLLHVDD